MGLRIGVRWGVRAGVLAGGDRDGVFLRARGSMNEAGPGGGGRAAGVRRDGVAPLGFGSGTGLAPGRRSGVLLRL